MIINQSPGGGMAVKDAIIKDYTIHTDSESIRAGNFIKFIGTEDNLQVIKSTNSEIDDGIVDGIAKRAGNPGDTIPVFTLSGTEESALSAMTANEFVEVINS